MSVSAFNGEQRGKPLPIDIAGGTFLESSPLFNHRPRLVWCSRTGHAETARLGHSNCNSLTPASLANTTNHLIYASMFFCLGYFLVASKRESGTDLNGGATLKAEPCRHPLIWLFRAIADISSKALTFSRRSAPALIPATLGMFISVVLGSLLLVIGLVFGTMPMLSGGVILWGVAWLCYLGNRKSAIGR
jgi:hypothetical protein